MLVSAMLLSLEVQNISLNNTMINESRVVRDDGKGPLFSVKKYPGICLEKLGQTRETSSGLDLNSGHLIAQ
jgi:hypothetical protein